MQREPATLCYDGTAVSGYHFEISCQRNHTQRLAWEDLQVTKLMRSVVIYVTQIISD